MDFELELMWIPVSDVDRAKRFYLEQAGFDLLVDIPDGLPGPHPDRADYMSLAEFSDPDGNRWLLQERRGRPHAWHVRVPDNDSGAGPGGRRHCRFVAQVMS